MLEVLVGDVAVVQKRDVRVSGLGFFSKRKGQGREPRQQAGLAALYARLDSVSPKAPVAAGPSMRSDIPEPANPNAPIPRQPLRDAK